MSVTCLQPFKDKYFRPLHPIIGERSLMELHDISKLVKLPSEPIGDISVSSNLILKSFQFPHLPQTGNVLNWITGININILNSSIFLRKYPDLSRLV